MKKIYLIDDNSNNQREVYNASYIDDGEYDDILVHVEKLNEKSDFSFLDNASCLLIHYTLEDFVNGQYINGSQKAKGFIEDYLMKHDLPNVDFSDGHSQSASWDEDNPNVISGIKKSEFYIRLRPFLDHYRKTDGEIDMRLIALGKDFKSELVNRWGKDIVSVFSGKSDSYVLSIGDLDIKAKRGLRNLLDVAQPKIAVTFDDVMDMIDDGEVSVGRLILNINNIINNIRKYGKNISVWQ